MPTAHPPPLTKRFGRPRLRPTPALRWTAAGLSILACLYLASPYVALWRLDRAAVNGPTVALAALVDIDAVRDQIRRRLNKEEESRIGEVSDAFIDWIQDGIRRQRSRPLAHSIDLAWIRELLLSHAEDRAGFWPAVAYAFFDSPTQFRVRIDSRASESAPGSTPPPVHLQFQRRWLGWRVIAAYY
jgi:hypothetical protein